MIRRFMGLVSLLIGSVLTLWIGYNLLVERQSEFQYGSFKQLFIPLIFLYVGVNWVRGKAAK